MTLEGALVSGFIVSTYNAFQSTYRRVCTFLPHLTFNNHSVTPVAIWTMVPPELGPWESVEVRTALSWGALIWLAWEWVVTFPSEYKYILKGERSVAKYLYLSTRYVALAGQITNQGLIEVLLRKSSLSLNLCRAWYGFQAGIVQTLYTSVEIVLMYRVYALYGRTLQIRASLILLFLLEGAVFIFTSAYTTVTIDFSPVCLVYKTPLAVLPMSAVAIIVQCIIWHLTLRKRTTAGNKNHPLMRTLTRDGGIVWGILCLFFSVITPYAYYVQVPTHSTFTFFITLLSILGCRLILNIHHVPSLTKESTSDIELTTQYTLSTLGSDSSDTRI